VTLREVSEGIRKFAPSYALDKLRLLCLARHAHVTETFEQANLDVLQAMDSSTFEQTLLDLDLDVGDYFKDISQEQLMKVIVDSNAQKPRRERVLRLGLPQAFTSVLTCCTSACKAFYAHSVLLHCQ